MTEKLPNFHGCYKISMGTRKESFLILLYKKGSENCLRFHRGMVNDLPPISARLVSRLREAVARANSQILQNLLFIHAIREKKLFRAKLIQWISSIAALRRFSGFFSSIPLSKAVFREL